jgi:hypothetical protein
MLSITLAKDPLNCIANSGGVSRAWVFDPADFTWTQAAATAALPYPPYTAIALMTGATLTGGSGFYPINFYYLTAEKKSGQSRKNTSNKWAHQFSCLLPYENSALINFIGTLQAASTCSSLGLVIEDYNGNITIMGEQFVGGNPIPALWRMLMDGTEITSGKQIEDDNAVTLMIKGDYIRPAIQFTGGLSAILALAETV